MSEDLATARRMAMEAESSDPTNLYCLLQSVWHLLFHLEAQEEQMQATAAQHRHLVPKLDLQRRAQWTEAAEPLPETPPSLESSPTTEPAITAPPWVALDDRIKAQIPLSQRVLGVLTDQELTAVDKSSKLRERLDRFVSSFKTLAPDAPGIISTSQSPASHKSVADLEPATLPSAGSNDQQFWFDTGRAYEAELRGDKGKPWDELKAELYRDHLR